MVVVTQTMEVEVASINHKDRARKQACVVGFVKRAVAIHGALLKNILFFKGFTNPTTQSCFPSTSSVQPLFLSKIGHSYISINEILFNQQ